MSNYIYRCARCHGREVQHAMWVHLNTNEVLSPFGTWCWGDNSWCQDCDDHTDIIDGEDAPPGARLHIFVALDNDFLCEDCLPADLRARLGDEDVQVWGEYSSGWTEPVICRDCRRSIPVFVNGHVAHEGPDEPPFGARTSESADE